jgi:hypothetical protein
MSDGLHGDRAFFWQGALDTTATKKYWTLAMLMRCTLDRWSATVRSGPDKRQLEVIGEGTCPKSGYILTLEPLNSVVNTDPKVLALQLKEIEPVVGAGVITKKRVRYVAEIGRAIRRVYISTRNGGYTVEISETAERSDEIRYDSSLDLTDEGQSPRS